MNTQTAAAEARHAGVLILDFGSQYTQLIARRIRELGVWSEILPCDADPDRLRRTEARAVILSGGPESVGAESSPGIPPVVFEMGVPILGICYGMQALAAHFGGRVESAECKEFGYAEVAVTGRSRLLEGIEDRIDADGRALLEVWMSHGDHVTAVPEGFEVICTTESAPIAGIADDSRGIYGLQFHPEVTHTSQGMRILERFVVDIAACARGWTTKAIIAEQIERVREQVGNDTVLLGLSGGVDSSVVAALLHRAIGDQLLCIFVDTGLLRWQEGDQVMATFARHLGVRVERIDARDRFLEALKGVSDPEQKRKIIGREFIRVFEEAAARHREAGWLAQGTIYPDVIESAGAETGKAKVIKSHHNVGGLPEDMNLKLIEPLRELFKDEVRRIGIELGLPKELVMRHPFPGPGLGVRILGEVRPEYIEPLQKADHIFISELQKAGLYDRVSQAFAVFLPVKSVGVVGDARRYEWVIALRAVETVDFMTARWARLDHDFLDRVARRIINEITGVSRVVYDISGKPPATIEWE
ncbi:MAG: glutamine-hydrolyzing GMP synthase [Wenzhouxiangellaceae bacterium]